MKNNKGFSLIELIIVIALISILTGASVVGLGYLYSTNLKSSVKNLDASLQKVQSFTVSKATGARTVGLKIKKTGSGCMVEFVGIPNQSAEEIGKKNLKVYYSEEATPNNWNEITNEFTINFDRATGGLLPQDNASGPYVKAIRLTTADNADDASKCCTIEISKITGKTTVKVYQ